MSLSNSVPLPPVLPGFEHIRRHWDENQQISVAKILPGEYYVTMEHEQIVTVLGSCVAACIRDPLAGIGGMNHFMLPETTQERLRDGREEIIGSATRYGNYAMEHLINTILEYGGQRKRLEIKVFGGGKVVPAMSDVGLRNIEFILDYLQIEGMQPLAQDLGDIYPRKLVYFPLTGRARVKRLLDTHTQLLLSREFKYRDQLKATKVESSIELF